MVVGDHPGPLQEVSLSLSLARSLAFSMYLSLSLSLYLSLLLSLSRGGTTHLYNASQIHDATHHVAATGAVLCRIS